MYLTRYEIEITYFNSFTAKVTRINHYILGKNNALEFIAHREFRNEPIHEHLSMNNFDATSISKPLKVGKGRV